jgi:hypothetical protein
MVLWTFVTVCEHIYIGFPSSSSSSFFLSFYCQLPRVFVSSFLVICTISELFATKYFFSIIFSLIQRPCSDISSQVLKNKYKCSFLWPLSCNNAVRVVVYMQ